MASIYNYPFFKGIAEAFEEVTGIHVPEKVTAIVFFAVFAITIIGFVLKPIIKNHKWRKKQLDDILKDYGEYTTWQQRWLYIKTWFQANPPHDLDDPSMAQYEDRRTDSIDFFINEALVPNNRRPPFYCILGGSGMGKSTFVVNLVWRYIHKYREKTLPYPIKLLYCGERVQGKDVLLERILEIKDKRNTILILDALDESNMAIDNYSDFSKDLLESIVDFRFVIITCRTQFFEKHEYEPEMVPKRQPGVGQQRFKKYYVSPLKEKEIRRYINKKYLFRFFAKKKAKAIMNNCNQIMARPLLLSYIDDLLNSHIEDRPESIIHIYEIIIDKWLEREANFAAPDNINEYKKTLLEFSSEIALCLARPTLRKAPTRISHQNIINTIIEKYKDKYVIKEKNLKGRSLLNRNSKNEFKFAHKSFMEYLVAKQLFEQKGIPLESIDCISNDMIPVFLSYMISDSSSKRKETIDIVLSDTLSIKRSLPRTLDYVWFYQSHRINRTAKLPYFGCIMVNCNVSETISKYISAFLEIQYIIGKEDKVIINKIVIDCNYDYSKIIEMFKTEIHSKIDSKTKYEIRLEFLNYDFCNLMLVELLKSIIILQETNCVVSVMFYISNKQVILSGNPFVIRTIHHLAINKDPNSNFPKIRLYCEEGNGVSQKANYPVDFNIFLKNIPELEI